MTFITDSICMDNSPTFPSKRYRQPLYSTYGNQRAECIIALKKRVNALYENVYVGSTA